MWLRGECVESR